MASWDRLSAAQRAAAFHQDGPAACYAGPGSGKTRVVTLRAARLAEQGGRVLVTTFTTAATEEMRVRLAECLPRKIPGSTHATTVHALCLSVLRADGHTFQLLTNEAQRRGLAEAARAADLEGGSAGFLTRTSYLKNTGETARSYRADGSYEDREFASAWRSYEKEKSGRGLKEFDDLLLDVRALFQQPEKRRVWSERYTHILVDECQDMNRPQYQIVLALGQDHHNVMLVGDPDQSLYAFRGADTETFRSFASNPATTVYELRENYRSAANIVTFAGSLIRQQEDRRPIDLRATRSEGADVRWEVHADAEVEAVAIGQQILALAARGARYRDIAVLYRMNAQAEAFERNFAAEGIPFISGAEGDFYARKEVAGILSYLEFFTSYTDDWLLSLLNVPNRKIPRTVAGDLRTSAEFRGKTIWEALPDFHGPDLRAHKAVQQLRRELEHIRERLQGITHAGEAIAAIRRATEFDNWLRVEELTDRDNDRIQNLERMQEAASHYPRLEHYLAAVHRVREETDRRKAEQRKRKQEVDAVTLATGHAAKGREWRAVFAAGWSEELLPHRKSEDLAEERRIAYVMATRARDFLTISSLQNWNSATVSPSRFLTGLNLSRSSVIPEPQLLPEDSSEPALGGLFIG